MTQSVQTKDAVAAMSGGVDSAVAALLAARTGALGAAFTMRLTDAEQAGAGPGRCCAPRDVRDARGVAARLSIPHYVLDMRDAFAEHVVRPFVAEYLAGRTPIPCVACNDRLKFAELVRRARALGACRVVTGHHARTERHGDTVRLLRGRDRAKDQAYFLHGLTQDQVRTAWFPVGEITKPEVREIAREAGLDVADKPESQEICFVPDGDAAAFVEREAQRDGVGVRAGEIVDRAGERVGAHGGVHRFTVGQRRGLGAHGVRLHVLELRAATDEVVVGPAAELLSSELVVERFNWIEGVIPPSAIDAEVQVRHGRGTARARVMPVGTGVRVIFDEPVRAVAPGQAAVVYDGDRVMGGGPIALAVPA